MNATFPPKTSGPQLSPMPSFSLDNTLGALFVGLVVSTALFGLTTLQSYMYFVNYRDDRAPMKWLVGMLWILDFVHTVLICHAGYHFFIQQYGRPDALARGEWSIIVEVGVTTAVTFLVQCFLAYRVYRLSSKNWYLTAVIVLLALGHVGLGTASTVKLFQIKLFSRLPEISDILSSTLIVMAVNDALITISLCFYLYGTQRHAIKNGSIRYDAVRLLILYTIETGLLTSVVVAIDAALALAMPNNWIFIGVECVLAKLYTNSLLTVLNSRNSIREKLGDLPSHTPGEQLSLRFQVSSPTGRISRPYSISLHPMPSEEIYTENLNLKEFEVPRAV